jgi:hypothetical protein
MVCLYRCLVVLSPLFFFLAGRLSREFLGGQAMAGDSSRDPDAVGRCPPYPRQPLPVSVSETRFLASPHLTVFLLSHEHMSEVLRGERVVTAPPQHSPLAPWLCSGNPEDFDGPILMS